MLIKVAVGSLCHTDGMVSDGIMGTKLPCIASHEGAGTVVKLGSAVKEFQVGDRILCSLTYHRCGVCADCIGLERDRQYCSKTGGHNGITRDGSFAEYEIVDGRECCILPDNLSFQSAAPLACAGISVVRTFGSLKFAPPDLDHSISHFRYSFKHLCLFLLLQKQSF